MTETKEDKPVGRRGFFRDGLAALLGPLANHLEKRLDGVRQSFAMVSSSQRLLRPPGALPEPDFLRICQSCGKCVAVCPAGAIYMTREPGLTTLAGKRVTDATPVINPTIQPCLMCAALACMPACPSGALVRLPADRIHMGTAALTAEHCRRTKGEECRRCIDQCPVGGKAIHLAEDVALPPLAVTGEPAGGTGELSAVIVESNACVGCGACEHACPCPADAKAVVVWPNR